MFVVIHLFFFFLYIFLVFNIYFSFYLFFFMNQTSVRKLCILLLLLDILLGRCEIRFCPLVMLNLLNILDISKIKMFVSKIAKKRLCNILINYLRRSSISKFKKNKKIVINVSNHSIIQHSISLQLNII